MPPDMHIMPTETDMPTTVEALLRLQSWLSPAFPIGAFSYSHGLETAVDDGGIARADDLRVWLEGVLRFGAGRSDAWCLIESWHATADENDTRLLEIANLAAALPGASELGLETRSQGAAFLATVRAVWPHERLATLQAVDGPVALPVSVGVAGAAHGVPLSLLLPLYLNGFVANLVSAGVRLVPLGQPDGQRVVAALEAPVAEIAARALKRKEPDPGSATSMIDICAMRHESQYTRLFRS